MLREEGRKAKGREGRRRRRRRRGTQDLQNEDPTHKRVGNHAVASQLWRVPKFLRLVPHATHNGFDAIELI